MTRKQRRKWEQFCNNGYERLATYNGERARGIVHTAEYDAKMAVLQAAFIAEQRAEAERKGWIIVESLA